MADTHRVFGWRPDRPDQRDHHYSLTAPPGSLARQCLYLPLKMPRAYDQGELGSCTGNGIAACMHYLGLRNGLEDPMPSRLFIYLEERRRERTIPSDAGAEIRDGIKVVASIGAPPESVWPYDTAKFALTPPPSVYAAAKRRHAIKYSRVQRTLTSIKTAIQFGGVPIVFGFSVYESFEGAAIARTGQMTIPNQREAVLGGHCTDVVGFDDDHINGPGAANGAALVRNSWGEDWGIHDPAHPEFNGHFWMPYDVLLNPDITDDFWIIEEETGAPLQK